MYAAATAVNQANFPEALLDCRFEISLDDVGDFARSEEVEGGETALRERVGAVCGEPFDLEEGPLLRAWIGRLSATDAVILLSAHHLALDGLSLLLLAREVVSLYDAIERDAPPPPATGAASFGEFVEWQASWLEESGTEAAAHWAALLQPAPPSLALPRDHLRPGSRVCGGGP